MTKTRCLQHLIFCTGQLLFVINEHRLCFQREIWYGKHIFLIFFSEKFMSESQKFLFRLLVVIANLFNGKIWSCMWYYGPYFSNDGHHL